ncbi:hypothetical protein KKI24_17300 [bacterium]|nr:hypothetical protein [bacterium]
MSIADDLIKPWELERDLKNEPDINRKIEQVTHAVGKLLQLMKTEESQQKINRLKENPFDKELAFQSLFSLYGNLFMVTKRFLEKVGEAAPLEKIQLGNKPAARILEEAVNKMIFSHERDELLAPVSARLGKKKGDYGPAMYSEYVKRVGRNLISSINNQINELLPTVTKICQGFAGVSGRFVSQETRSGSEREKYEDVWLIYQAEKAARERIAEIAAISRDKVAFFQDLLDDFTKIKTAYQEKIESLAYLREQTQDALDGLISQGEETTEKLDLEKQLTSLGEKTRKLLKGNDKLVQIERLLQTLKNLIEKFPGIQNQIEFFIESDYQAKSVYKFLEEINQEMKGIFGQQNIQAFEVIGALVYKLKATSRMYEDANYYQAVARMVDDVTEFLKRRLAEKREKNINQKVMIELRKSGLEEGALVIHQTMNRIKELNNQIHQVLVEFGDRLADRKGSGGNPESRDNSRKELTAELEKRLASVEKLSRGDIFSQYRFCQKQFQGFTELNLEEKHIGEQVLRAFLELSGRGETPAMKKEELLNFQKFKLYQKMMPAASVQAFYSEALKKFMRGEPCDEMSPTNIRLRFVSEIAQIEEKQQKKPTAKAMSKHETAIRFVAENVTPKEIESLARFVPCMPRNELRLTYPPGKVFIEIADRHMAFMRRESQRQYVLLNPGEIRKSENEISFRELSGKELIKKAYGLLHRHLEPVFARINEETNREEDFINRERNKWQKELDQVILYLQYQIESLSSENLNEVGGFRTYSAEECSLIAKYISADQFDRIESLFGRKYLVDKDSVLADVEVFLVQVIVDFYQLMEKDELLKSAFQETQEERKQLHLGGKTDNISRKINDVSILIRQKSVDRLLAFWEYGINRILPKTEQTLKDPVEQTQYSDQELVQMAECILPGQLRSIRENLALIRSHSNEKQMPILVGRGQPLLKIAQICFDILEKDEAMILPHEDACRKKLAEFAGDTAFRDDIDRILSLKTGPPASDDPAGDTGSSTQATIVSHIDRLLAAFQGSLSGAAATGNLPKVSGKNLKSYVRYIDPEQIGKTAAAVRGTIGKGAVHPAEKRLLIIATYFLKENPDAVSREERKAIIRRWGEVRGR